MNTTDTWIAIVDDEQAIRLALLRLLDAVGLQARAFESGVQLVSAMRRQWPCCVILDLNLPGCSGHRLQARLARIAPRLPVIAMTGHHSPSAEARVLQYPNATYLRKPMAEHTLLAAIGAACINSSDNTVHARSHQALQ